jgi:hypothetical protein
MFMICYLVMNPVATHFSDYDWPPTRVKRKNGGVPPRNIKGQPIWGSQSGILEAGTQKKIREQILYTVSVLMVAPNKMIVDAK